MQMYNDVLGFVTIYESPAKLSLCGMWLSDTLIYKLDDATIVALLMVSPDAIALRTSVALLAGITHFSRSRDIATLYQTVGLIYTSTGRWKGYQSTLRFAVKWFKGSYVDDVAAYLHPHDNQDDSTHLHPNTFWLGYPHIKLCMLKLSITLN